MAQSAQQLMRHHDIKLTEPVAPPGVVQIVLNKLHPRSNFAEPQSCQCMHRRCRIDRHVRRGGAMQQPVGNVPRPGAKLENAPTHRRQRANNGVGDPIEARCTHAASRQLRVSFDPR